MLRIIQAVANLIQSPRGLRNVLAFKLIAALALLAAFKQEIFFGEIKTTAAEEVTPAEAAKGPKTPDVGGKEKAKASKEAATTAEAKTEDNELPKRKSFLDDLLNLPKLNPDNMKKESIGRYLTLAEKKKQQLEGRLDVLKKREEQLVKIEQSIDGKLQKLDDERKFFAQSLQREKDLKGKRVDRLIELYAKMEPRKAAPIIEKLDRDLVVEILKQVDKKQAKSILESMDPQKSVELTEYFGRVRSAKEYDLLKELNLSLRKEFQDCRGMPRDQEEDNKDEKSDKKENGQANANPAAAAPAGANAETPATPAPAGEAKAPAGEKEVANKEAAAPDVAVPLKSEPEKPAPKVAEAEKPEAKASGNPETSTK